MGSWARDMLLQPEPVRIPSPDASAIVLERLRRTAAEWRETAFLPHARAAGIAGWILRESDAGVVFVRKGWCGPFMPAFKGRVVDTQSGSVIVGELRAWALGARTMVTVWQALPWLAVILVLVVPITGVKWSWVRVPIAVAIVLAGLVLGRGLRWAVNNCWPGDVEAITEALHTAASGLHAGSA